MTAARLSADALEVRLAAPEKVLGLLPDLRVPRSSVLSAEVVADGLAAVTGVRAPGLGVPGRVKVGTWRTRTGRQWVSVRRGEPALVLRLQDHRYERAVVGTADAQRLADALAR